MVKGKKTKTKEKMRKKIILTPIQSKIIKRKLEEAKQSRLIKQIAFNTELTPRDKVKQIRTIINGNK